MCDYSLHNVRNRLAAEGEPLQVHRFPTGSLGLVSLADLQQAEIDAKQACGSWWQRIKDWFSSIPTSSVPAVCVPPGARLILRELPSLLQKRFDVRAEEEVTFVQLNPEGQGYHDAIRFHNGREVLLQRLPIGQQLDVLDLGYSTEEESPIAQTVERIPMVSSSTV